MDRIIQNEIRRVWQPRKKTAHKGNFGRVFILAGSKGLSGAAHLAGMGAVRAGAGLVTVGVPESIYRIAARRESEVMVKPFTASQKGSLAYKSLAAILKFQGNQTVLAVGPGLSQEPAVGKLIRGLIARTAKPVVLDADGLNAFSQHSALLKKTKASLILTPHAGEFTRLFGIKLSDDLRLRKRIAAEIAQAHRCTLVLKGHQTIIASAEGKVFVNRSGNPGMASGGMGDVLTGMIAALLGQGFDPVQAARFGVYFHGLAGDLAVKQTGQISLAASDVLNHLPLAFKKVLKF